MCYLSVLEVLVFFQMLAPSAFSVPRFVPKFTASYPILHQGFDPYAGRVYLGCSNKLYQLNSNLELEIEVSTGPEDVSATESVDNINKALLVYSDLDMLISCGTGYDGACETRKLHNISIAKVYRDNFDLHVFKGSHLRSFAFLAPVGPFSGSDRSEMAMYVATTSDLSIKPPVVSTREIHNEEDRFNVKQNAKVEMFQDSGLFPRFVSGFSHQGFSYFLSFQPQGGFVSRLARVCQKDENYYSYIEVPLECSKNGKSYSLVQNAFVTEAGSSLAASMNISTNESILYGIFTNGPTSAGDVTSALCMYTLSDIRTVLYGSITKCFRKGQGRRVSYLSNVLSGGFDNGKCFSSDVPDLSETYCGQHKWNNPLLGSGSIAATPVHEFQDKLTTVAVTSVNNITVAYLGTTSGMLKKMTISSMSEGHVYENLSVNPGHTIGSDIMFDKNKTHLYVTAKDTVVKLAVSTCDQYTNCDTCLGSKDPYCGWCSLEKKCSQKEECSKSSMTLRWLGYGTDQCLAVTSISQTNTSLDVRATVHLEVNKLPDAPGVDQPYTCIFGEGDMSYEAPANSLTTTGLACLSPPLDRIPEIVAGDNVAVPLKIRSSETGIDFLKTEFYFFNCSVHSICGECVTTQWSCDWCIWDNKCTDNSSTCSGDFIASDNYPFVASHQGKDHCPRLEWDHREILLPDGVSKEFTVHGRKLPDPGAGGKYECVVRQGDPQEIRAPAERKDNKTVICRSHKYSYKENIESLVAPMTVVWNNDRYLDSDINVTMFKCNVMGPDCSRCLSPINNLSRYDCVWCPSNLACQYNTSCDRSSTQCPKPTITKIYPESGPIEGGTNLTIYGNELGKKFDDIDRIRVVGRTCTPIKERYLIAEKIVCEMGGPSRETDSTQGLVVVFLKDGPQAKSVSLFKFRLIH